MKEFIVNCENNSTEERAEVYKWLVKTRGYSNNYLNNDYPYIGCNKLPNHSNFIHLESATQMFPNHPIYTFEEFKNKYLEKKRRNDKRKRNERINVGHFREDIF